MTDNTQPEALRLAEMLTADEWPGSVTLVSYARECVAELRRQHARITALESQLAQRFDAADMATAAAQGFRDGVASVAANVGSEPVAWQYRSMPDVGGVWFECSKERADQRAAHPERWEVRPLYDHPSPQEGMAGWKWVPVEPTEEMLAAAHDGDREYTLRNFGDVMTVMQGPYDHWAAMIAAAPHPPTTSPHTPGRQPAPEYVGNGMFKGETIEKAAEHWANWCDSRCMTGLSEFLRVVAARAPADSVPVARFDDPKVQAVYAILCSDVQPPEGEHWEGFAARRIVDALSADSVLEDAARYRYLRDGDWREHEKLESVIRLQLNALWDETIDAARKQGGAT